MTGRISREQALAVFESMQGGMCYVLKPALEAWLHAVEHLPQHPRSPHAGAAIQAIQNAIQQAPSGVQAAEALEWARTHLTEVGKLMTTHMHEQIDISMKRLNILQQLHAGQEQGSSQLFQRWAAEATSYHWLKLMRTVLWTVNPAAAVVEALQTNMADSTVAAMDILTKKSSKPGKVARSVWDYSNKPAVKGWRHLISYSMQKGTELLDFLEHQLQEAQSVQAQIQVQMEQIHEQIEAVNARLLDSWMHEEVLCRQTQLSKQLHLTGAMVWIRMISDLPTGMTHGVVDEMIRSINWDLLQFVHQQVGMMHAFWCKLLARPSLTEALLRVWSPQTWGCFLRGYGITQKDMQKAGLSKDVQRQLQRYKQDVKVWGTGAVGAKPSQGKQSKPDVEDQACTVPTEEAAADAVAVCDGQEGEQDEMQALVQMMYGQSVPVE